MLIAVGERALAALRFQQTLLSSFCSDVAMSDQSPQWKKPSDVMIMRKLKKPATRSSSGQTATVQEKTAPQNTGKRSNPFVCSPGKRKKISRKPTRSRAEDHQSNIAKIDDKKEQSVTLLDFLSASNENQQVGAEF